jgi:hypothetical protein
MCTSVVMRLEYGDTIFSQITDYLTDMFGGVVSNP